MIVLHYRAIKDLREQVRRAATPSTPPAGERQASRQSDENPPEPQYLMPRHHPDHQLQAGASTHPAEFTQQRGWNVRLSGMEAVSGALPCPLTWE